MAEQTKIAKLKIDGQYISPLTNTKAVTYTESTTLDDEINNINTNMLKKDGSVQMTGVLKTVGGSDTTPTTQIDMGKNAVISKDGKTVYLAINCYHDGTNWKYKTDGDASIIVVSIEYDFPILNTTTSGIKDSIITWTNNNILTDSGGNLKGSLKFVRDWDGISLEPISNGANRGGIVRQNVNVSLPLQETAMINTSTMNKYGNETHLTLAPIEANLYDHLHLKVIKNDGAIYNVYKIYGEHNITVSQAAPSTTLANGCMHNVY